MPPAAELGPGYRHLCNHPGHLRHLQRVSGENEDSLSPVSSVLCVVRSILVFCEERSLSLVEHQHLDRSDYLALYKSVHAAFAEPGPLSAIIYHQPTVSTLGA